MTSSEAQSEVIARWDHLPQVFAITDGLAAETPSPCMELRRDYDTGAYPKPEEGRVAQDTVFCAGHINDIVVIGTHIRRREWNLSGYHIDVGNFNDGTVLRWVVAEDLSSVGR